MLMEKQSDDQRREKKRLAQAAWRNANKEHIKAYNAAYVRRSTGVKRDDRYNKDDSIARARAWQAANPERVKENKKAWQEANREKFVGYTMKWRASNPEAARAIHSNRRAKKMGAKGRVSADIREKLFVLQKGKCPCCGKPLGDDCHLDHKMPLALGGTNTDDNMQLLRAKCNMEKSAKHPIDFMQSRGFLL